MSAPAHRYPVDRYLVESSKTFGKVNILDDDLWNSEPALRPEDEIILRKLQEMLQSTAEDLKLLSREINVHKEPRVKTLPTPLDEEFNEKVHIQEVVDAKFHGYKILEPREQGKINLLNNVIKNTASKQLLTEKINAVDKQINTDTVPKKPLAKMLRVTKTRTLSINGENKNVNKSPLPNKKIEKPSIAYNEYCYNYTEPKEDPPTKNSLKVQHMPSINIRSELKEQKVLQLDIVPEIAHIEEVAQQNNRNVAVLAVTHEPVPIKSIPFDAKKAPQIQHVPRAPIRRVTKMSTCDSSDSSNNCLNKEQQVNRNVRPRNSETSKYKNNPTTKKVNKNLELWKKKLNAVYGPSKQSPKKKYVISARKKTNINNTEPNTPYIQTERPLNNAQYIPYSKLTVGGVRASDIEREIGDITDKGDSHISPIIDKILSSRDQSFIEDKNNKNLDSGKVLDTSDEKLLQEVIDIEEAVSKTLAPRSTSKNNDKQPEIPTIDIKSNSSEEENYDDDFEDDKSENDAKKKNPETTDSKESSTNSSDEAHGDNTKNDIRNQNTDIPNETYTKSLNLSFKNSVDVFEFIHSVDTQEIATQSCTTHKISLKETQTSPKNDDLNTLPPQIYNDLWPTIDPKGEVENLFKLEKEFIKKLILEEYGDLLEANISKPSTSNENKAPNQLHTNVILTQKITQTSPAKVKSAMTSPKVTKTRMTSPFAVSVTVGQQTSPVEVNTQEELKVELENSNEDLGISINLSSPRFSLRLPQNTREVLSNLDICSQTFTRSPKTQIPTVKTKVRNKTFTQTAISSSSSEELNSSEISSLGEITSKLRKKLRKSRVSQISISSASSSQKSSSDYHSHGILPVRSEGEVSVGQVPIKKKVPSNSDGEINKKQMK